VTAVPGTLHLRARAGHLDRVFLELTGLFWSCLGVLPPRRAVLSLCPHLSSVVLVLQFGCWQLLLLVLFGVSIGVFGVGVVSLLVGLRLVVEGGKALSLTQLRQECMHCCVIPMKVGSA
jgi:hypothetical protein